jgi:endonuclease/exonuclease/phosphatase family metal-dependent hydrolase
MTYNIEDIRTQNVRRTDHPRLQRAAACIQALAPEILLVNEMTYDQPGAPGYEAGDPKGQNARRFVENYLSVPQADTLEGQAYQTVMLPVNTGLPSGYDLNNDGRVVTEVPPVPPSPEDGRVAEQTAQGRAYGGDAWGFGTFPGQYGMALFVRPDLTVLRDSIRTFRLFEWSAMPNAAEPVDTTNGASWYSDEAWRNLRLSSKSHWDVPVRLPDGIVLHVLASHPTPPGFDGPARRNDRRNHDEIRLWVDYTSYQVWLCTYSVCIEWDARRAARPATIRSEDSAAKCTVNLRNWYYLSGATYIEDDSSRGGGLHDDASFVVVGDLNADPDDESPFRQAVRDLVSHERVHSDAVPTASAAGQSAYPNLEPDETARWGHRHQWNLATGPPRHDHPSRERSLSGLDGPPSHAVTRRSSAAIPLSDHGMDAAFDYPLAEIPGLPPRDRRGAGGDP